MKRYFELRVCWCLLSLLFFSLRPSSASFLSPFRFFQAGKEIENSVSGHAGATLSLEWTLEETPHELQNAKQDYISALNADVIWAMWCPPASNALIASKTADPRIAGLGLSIKEDIKTFAMDTTGTVRLDANIQQILPPKWLKEKAGCQPINAAAVRLIGGNPSKLFPHITTHTTQAIKGSLDIPLVGFGTMWFVSPFGLTPLHHNPATWSTETDLELDSRRIYLCPGTGATNTLVLADAPRCSQPDDDPSSTEKPMVADVTIFVPHIVFYSHNTSTCYIKDTLFHTYESFGGNRDNCAPCPRVILPKQIDRERCLNWKPGATCTSTGGGKSGEDLSRDKIRAATIKQAGDDYSNYYTKRVDGGTFSSLQGGARTANNPYFRFTWCGVNNYVARNCYSVKGHITVKGPDFNDFLTGFGPIPKQDAIAGMTRRDGGFNLKTTYFDKFTPQELCGHSLLYTIKNARLRVTDLSKESLGSGAIPTDSRTLFEVTSRRLKAVFASYDTQKIDTDILQDCITHSALNSTTASYYHISSDRIMRIDNVRKLEEVSSSNPQDVKKKSSFYESIVYGPGYSNPVSTTNMRDATKETAAKKDRFKNSPKTKGQAPSVSFMNTVKTSGTAPAATMAGDQQAYYFNTLSSAINSNAHLLDRSICEEQRRANEDARAQAILFPSKIASRRAGRRVKVHGRGGDYMRISACVRINNYRIIANVRLDNAENLNPRYAYRVFSPHMSVEAIKSRQREEALKKAIGPGSASIAFGQTGPGHDVYLHRDLTDVPDKNSTQANSTLRGDTTTPSGRYLQSDVLESDWIFGQSTKKPATFRTLLQYSGINTDSPGCFQRPLIEFPDPKDSRVRLVAILDENNSAKLMLDGGYVETCPKIHMVGIEESVAVYASGQVVGVVDRNLLHDHKELARIKQKISDTQDAEIRAQGQQNSRFKRQAQSSAVGVGAGASGSAVQFGSFSPKQLRESVGLAHGGGVLYGLDAESLKVLREVVARVVVSDAPSFQHHTATKVPESFFDIYNDEHFDYIAAFIKVMDHEYSSVLNDLSTRLTRNVLDYIGNAARGRNPKDIQDPYSQEQTSGSDWGSQIGNVLEGLGGGAGLFVKESLEGGGEGVEHVLDGAGELVEDTGRAADGLIDSIGSFFSSTIGKIIIAIIAIVVVGLVGVGLFFCITSWHPKDKSGAATTEMGTENIIQNALRSGEIEVAQDIIKKKL